MKIITTRQAMREAVDAFRAQGKTIGFVPTMGYLHEGHLSLVKRARSENDVAVVSIFVNPAQFGPNEDFSTYPSDLERDKGLLDAFADYVFSPDDKEMYGGNEQICLVPKDIMQCLCGLSRPHHFGGVAMVVAKLFNIVKPHRAYFGQKDYQQTVVIKHLIEDLFLEVEPVVCPTVREADGLAMSSRNVYLSAEERKQSAVLYQSLRFARKLLESGEKNAELIIQKIQELIAAQPLARIDYVDIREADSLHQAHRIDQKSVVIALAVFFGKTRLIDNYLFTPRQK